MNTTTLIRRFHTPRKARPVRAALREGRAFQLRLTLVTLAVLGTCVAAQAEAPPPVESTVTLGLAGVIGDKADQAQYALYGMPRSGRRSLGLFGFDVLHNDDADNTLIQFSGIRLFGDTRELEGLWRKQASWRLRAHYGESVRHEPYTVNTGLVGAGSTAPQVNAVAAGQGGDLHLKVKRTALGLGLSRWIDDRMQFEVDLRSENKEGARIFGIGINCPSAATPGCAGVTGIRTGWAVLMLPEPIRANHSQVDVRLNLALDKLRLTLGYYGSFYDNRYGSMSASIPGSLNNALGDLLPLSTGLQALLAQPIALPPDSQAHQFDVTGSYDISRTARANFKIARGQATQHQDFAAAGLTGGPAGRSNLGGRIDTTLVQLGLSARPETNLSLHANLRYEDRDDRTPLATYDLGGAGASTNRRLPQTKIRGRVEAAWRLPADLRATFGADIETIDRGVFTATSAVSGISALRQQTEERSVRAELRRTLGETITGALSLHSSRRDGSNWLKPNAGAGVSEVVDPADPASGFTQTALFMPTLADRRRDKVRLFADWSPDEAINVQFSAEEGSDRYRAPTAYGMQRSRMSQFGIDWTLLLSDDWTLNGHVSQGHQALHQARAAGAITAYDNRSTEMGLGLTGKLSSKLELGGSLAFSDDTSSFRQTLDALAGADSAALLAASGGLPDVVFRQATVRLHARYVIDKTSSIRLDLLHQRSVLDDWAWSYDGVPFAYADGSTLRQGPKQNIGYVGISYSLQWR